MKVCQLCAVDFTVKHFLLPIVDGMQSRNWQVTVVCSEGAYTEALKEQGYPDGIGIEVLNFPGVK